MWLNPISERGWHGWTIKIIQEVFPMFPLTVDGIDRAVAQLVKSTPEPVRPLSSMYPELREFDHLDDLAL